ncbi:MAG: glutamate--tRNA ligase family protein [Tepidisphaeraceae bacterium]
MALRIEDLDGPRVKPGAADMAIDDLRWLGLDWDDGPTYQSGRASVYRSAVDRLIAAGVAYPCVCSRKEVELAASAPHASDGSAIYPGTCRGRFRTMDEARHISGRESAVRFAVPADRVVRFDDGFAGHPSFDVARELGDFVILKNDGTAAYQLAVVIDDAAAGVTHIVRGDDLLDSTPRQILLYEALGMADRIPTYTHVPLVTGPDGRRLAKRHGDTRLRAYRDAGVPAARILTLLAGWCGIDPPADCTTARTLIGRFELERLPKGPIRFDGAL